MRETSINTTIRKRRNGGTRAEINDIIDRNIKLIIQANYPEGGIIAYTESEKKGDNSYYEGVILKGKMTKPHIIHFNFTLLPENDFGFKKFEDSIHDLGLELQALSVFFEEDKYFTQEQLEDFINEAQNLEDAIVSLLSRARVHLSKYVGRK